MLKEVKDGVQKSEVLAVAHNLNRSFETLHSNAAANTTETLNRLEHVSKMREHLNDAVQRSKAITMTGTEEFPLFLESIVQAAVNNAIETHLQDTESLPNCQQQSNDIYNSMSIRDSERLGGKRKNVNCSIQRRHCTRKTKSYHFWFGKIRIKTLKRDLSYESSNHEWSSNTCESLWHAKILVLPAPWVLRKGTLVALEYVTRENRKTSFQINIEPVRMITEDSPVFRACYEGDLNAVHQLIEGGQASRHDRDQHRWTLLDETLRGIFFETRKPTRARDTENLIQYLISIGMDISEDSIFSFT